MGIWTSVIPREFSKWPLSSDVLCLRSQWYWRWRQTVRRLTTTHRLHQASMASCSNLNISKRQRSRPRNASREPQHLTSARRQNLQEVILSVSPFRLLNYLSLCLLLKKRSAPHLVTLRPANILTLSTILLIPSPPT